MRDPSHQPISSRAVASLTVAIVVLMIAGAISIMSTSSSIDLFRETILANAITHQLDALEELVLNEETAQRGFLISGRESYLEPYEKAEAQLRARLGEIEQALQGKPGDMRLVGEIEHALERMRKEIAATLDTYRHDSPEAAFAIVMTDQGKGLMDDFRSALDQLREINEKRREVAREKLLDQLTYTNIAVISATLISLLAGVLGVWFVRRGLQSQQRSELMRIEKERAEEADRHKTQFLANISHEIRTPMNAIIGFSRLLAQHISDEKERGYIDAIVVSGKGLLALVNDMLDLSKIEAGKLELAYDNVNLIESVDSVIGMFSQMAKDKGISLMSRLASTLPDYVLLDGHRLHQILVNLLSNAVKFTERGHVALEAAGDAAQIDPSLLKLTFTVTDTGAGIAPADLDAIFDPFSQGNRGGGEIKEGTGLGLAITQRLVALMDGTLRVNSDLGKGSTFTVELPNVAIIDVLKPSADRQVTLDQVGALGLKKILIVDDVQLNRDLLRHLLRSCASDILLAADGEEAVSVAVAERPSLILLDIRMPRLDGRAALERMRSHDELRGTPVIAVTASSMRDQEIELRRRFDGYVRKPISVEALSAEIVRVFSRRSQPSAATDNANSGAPDHAMSAAPAPADLVGGLESLQASEWARARATLSHQDVLTFVARLRELADKHSAGDLSDYSARLGSAATRFDIVAMEHELDKLPSLAAQYRQLGNDA